MFCLSLLSLHDKYNVLGLQNCIIWFGILRLRLFMSKTFQRTPVPKNWRNCFSAMGKWQKWLCHLEKLVANGILGSSIMLKGQAHWRLLKIQRNTKLMVLFQHIFGCGCGFGKTQRCTRQPSLTHVKPTYCLFDPRWDFCLITYIHAADAYLAP